MKPASGARRGGRESLLAAAFFLGMTVLMTWPQAVHPSDAAADLLDAKLSAWILHWDFVQTLRHPLELFQAPILHPARNVLAFSENMYGAAVFGFPILALGGPGSIFLNYNVNLLVGMFLSALSAWALARYVTGDALASLAAGMVYAFLPYKIAQLPHLHMEWGAFLCLVFLQLLRYLDGGRRRDAILLGIFFAWDVLACIQYAFFTGFLLVVVLVLEAAAGGPERWRRIRGSLVSLSLAAAACLPFLIPYAKASALYGMRRSIGEMTYFSAQPGDFLSAGFRNRVWGPLTARWRGHEGDFFPGLLPVALAAIAVLELRRAAAGSRPRATAMSEARRRVACVLDAAVIVTALAWAGSLTRQHFRLGALSLGDPGRILVILTLLVLARLAVAFPAASQYASLGDLLRRMRLDRRAFLLLAVGAAGVLASLGGHTPYYRFLFQSLGGVFRAVRVAARGVVLFQVALAVLAAWGLSLGTRNLSRRARLGWIAAALCLITLEYRAFPIELQTYDPGPQPVYEWLRSVDPDGGLGHGVVEWPLGFPNDCEYTLRQAEHEKPLVNGHSSFAPRPYEDLQGELHLKPIPDTIWSAFADLDAGVAVYHPAAASPSQAAAYRGLIRRGLAGERLDWVGTFPEGPDGARAYVFRLANRRPFDSRLSAEAVARGRKELEAFLAASDGAVEPPFGVLQVPEENQTVEAGSWGFGWALDDSGIAEIRIGTELGPSSLAKLGGEFPGLARTYPEFSDSSNGGYGFALPAVPPGPHVLRVTLVGKDGGTTTLERHVTVAPERKSKRP